MITIKLTTGDVLRVPGTNQVTLRDGTHIEFSSDDISVSSRVLKLTRKEKWAALIKWVPGAWKQSGGDLSKLAALAISSGFYSTKTGDMQMLWSVMKKLNLYPK